MFTPTLLHQNLFVSRCTDNPNRKKRAYELQNDLENLKTMYDESQKYNEAVFKRAHDKLNAVLKAMGIDSLDELGMLLLFCCCRYYCCFSSCCCCFSSCCSFVKLIDLLVL